MKRFSNDAAATVAALNRRFEAATNSLMIFATTLRSPCSFAVVLTMSAFAVAGCSSSTSSTSGGTSGAGAATCKAGPEAAYANPAGTPLSLPAGVTVEGDISGDIDAKCPDKNDLEYGSDLVLACVALRNAGTTDATVTLPAGLTFIAKTPTTTNGIILQSHDVTVPAGSVKHLYFRPFSLNRACDAGGPNDAYAFGNVTTDAKLREVIMLASTKQIDGDVGSVALGNMIWDITEGSGGITDEHRADLMKAPNKQ